MPGRPSVESINGLGLRLVTALREIGISQSDLAARASVSRQTISRAVNRDEATLPVVRKLAKALGRPVTYLIGRETTRSSEGALPILLTRDEVAAAHLTGFGMVVELLREDTHASQEQLAEDIGVSLSTYRRAITGKARLRDEQIELILGALDVDALPRDYQGLEALQAAGTPHRFSDAGPASLRGWRLASGHTYGSLAEMHGQSEVMLARFEAGIDTPEYEDIEVFAQVFGVPTVTLIRTVLLPNQPVDTALDEVLTTRSFEKHWPVVVSSYEGAEKAARERLQRRWESPALFEFQSALFSTVVNKLNGDTSVLADRTGIQHDRLFDLLEGEGRPSLHEIELLAVSLSVAPWQLLYGTSPLEQASHFPSVPEHRADLFSMLLPREARALIYRLLAELAERNADDEELIGLRRRLTDPYLYYQWQWAPPMDRDVYLLGVLREEARVVWRQFVQPGWADLPQDQRVPLPEAFGHWDVSLEKRYEAARSAAQLGMQRGHREVMERLQGAFPLPPVGATPQREDPAQRILPEAPVEMFEPVPRPKTSRKRKRA